MKTSVKTAKKTVSVIVPIYADWPTIKQNIHSLRKFYAGSEQFEIYYVNDCGPKVDDIEQKIISNIKGLNNFYYFRNEKNLGFVKNCNNAVFKLVKNSTSDILLLNSDTIVTEGFLEEMQRVLYSQEHICAVNPRSNNATVWSIPSDGSLADSPQKSFRLWQSLKNTLPDSYLTPTAHGFCMLIRRVVIDQIGLFDEVYGSGYGEENDFTMRARKDGWVCAVANHAFVFHHGSKSFGLKKQKSLSSSNSKILLKRYPEYNKLIAQYVFEHPEPLITRPANRFFTLLRLPTRVLRYVCIHGLRTTLGRVRSVIRNRCFVQKSSDAPTIHVWSHEVTRSGAPLVLFDVIKQWKKLKCFPKNISFNVPAGARLDQDLIKQLSDSGIKFNILGPHEVYFGKNDSVILNSTAQPEWLYQKIIHLLLSGKLCKLYYYIHEDDERTAGATAKHRDALRTLIVNDKVIVYAPSNASSKNWERYFGVSKNIFSMPGRIAYYRGMFQPRSENDFNKIDFIIAGSREPRKGIPEVLHALQVIERFYISKKPDRYRTFTLTIVGDDHNNDFYNRFISNAVNYFGDRVILKGSTDHDKVYKLMKDCNFTITYSIADSLSMVTFEGMSFGHPIIRSEASGVEEQLLVGKNGWLARTTNWNELVDALEAALNKDTTPNSKLSQMSRQSIKIAKQNYEDRYRILDDIRNDAL